MDDVIAQLRAADEFTEPPRPFDLGTSLRQARARTRRRRAGLAVSGVAVSAAAALGAFLVWPDPPDGEPQPAGPVATYGDPREQLSLLETPRGSEDRLPDRVTETPLFSDSMLVASSMRYLAEHDGARFWAGVSRDGYACLVMVAPLDKLHAPPEDDWTWSSGCGGLGMSMEAAGVEARLEPDGYERTEEDRREWTFVTPNLAVPKD